MKIVFASNNKGKIKEVKKILSEFTILTLEDIGFTEEIEETGTTFEENSYIKALAVSKKTSYPVLSDDSGLSVNALLGRPGVYSKRFSKEGTSKSNNLLLLQLLKDKKDRSAQFICVMTFIYKETVLTSKGIVNGLITKEFRGPENFGYDPLFLVEEYGLTMAEMGSELKNTLSHRGLALKNIKGDIYELFNIQWCS